MANGKSRDLESCLKSSVWTLYLNSEYPRGTRTNRRGFQDPSTGARIGSCPESTNEDAQEAIAAAAKAFPTWRSRCGRDRSRILRRWFELIISNSEDLAMLIGWENGKAIPDAVGEVASAASFIEWYSEEAVRIYGDVIQHSSANLRVSVLKEPLGVCGLITPYVELSHHHMSIFLH